MKKRIVCAVLAGMLAISMLSGCSSGSSGSGTDNGGNANNGNIFSSLFGQSEVQDTGFHFVREIGGKKVYFANGAYILNDDNSVTLVKAKGIVDGKEQEQFVWDNNQDTVFDNNKIYIQHNDKSTMYDLNDIENPTFETFLAEDAMCTFLNGDKQQHDEDDYNESVKFLKSDNQYIYFICYPSPEIFNDIKEYAFKMGRIDKATRQPEWIGNEICNSYGAYVVDNGWIYFYDNGYDPQNTSSPDKSRIGIYKMKTDGSEKTLVYSDFNVWNDGNWTERNGLELCSDMTMYDGYLYFAHHGRNGESKLYKMKPDGSDVQPVTNHGVGTYTIADGKIYYITSNRKQLQANNETVYVQNLDGSDETKLFECDSWNCNICIDGDYMYFNNFTYYSDLKKRDMDNPDDKSVGVCGQRFNLNTNTMENLYGYMEVRYKEDEFFGVKQVVEQKAPVYYWKAVPQQEKYSFQYDTDED